MSVYKPKNSPFYHFDFQRGGRRFHGSTEKTTRREADLIEKSEIKKAEKAVQAARATKGGPLTLDQAAERYWHEVGQHHANADTTSKDLERLISYFGEDKLLADITDDDVSKLVQWRRSQRRWGRETMISEAPMPFVSNATVNRSTTLVLKKLFTRAKHWRHVFPDEPHWKAHWLSEPKEKVRELRREERQALKAAVRDDYRPIIDFAMLTGLRLKECLLRWSNVNWDTGRIETIGKGGKIVRTALTPSVRAILEPQRGHDLEWVFTYEASRTAKKTPKTSARIKGQRYPITYEGLKSAWDRLRKAAGVTDFRFHDIRHDVGTKLLRMTGNLKTVQRALNHADIKTTTRYAHVHDEEVAADLERLARKQDRDRKSRKKPRSEDTSVSQPNDKVD